MISVLPTQSNTFRAFGWVQDPSNLRSLCDVVAVFDCHSQKHRQLKEEIIPQLVEERDGRERLIELLSQRPLRLPYAALVGTSFTPRSASRCNGIVQAAVKGQGRAFIGDWPADNFVRWAHCFGFISYSYSDDTFAITEAGLALTAAVSTEETGPSAERTAADAGSLSEAEIQLLREAVLSYAPVIRILRLLAEEDAHLTKFEIGRQLGFIGEDGFTSMPQKLLGQSLAEAQTAKEKSAMKADWEGSSDKYARMISSWLEKLGLVRKEAKTVTVEIAGRICEESIGQAYRITGAGLTALRRAEGKSRHKRIEKRLCWEMLATKGADREYVRTRRALILKCLSEAGGSTALSQVASFLSGYQLYETEQTIEDDIRGFVNIGIDIRRCGEGYQLKDSLQDFVIPLPQSLAKSELSAKKEELRMQITQLSHEYLALLDLAYDSKQNRLFEMKTLELLTEECGFRGLHLGGSRRPDGIIYTEALGENYGVIIDTKAYSKGYSLPISQADEMERYIGENQSRDEAINPNKWWENFAGDVNTFYFMFVSGHFKGNYRAQIQRISKNRGVRGVAVSISDLLLLAQRYRSGELSHAEIEQELFSGRQPSGLPL